MFSNEVKKMLLEVITSWQVITVTVVLIIYIFIVNSVARLYRRSRPREIPPIPKEKPEGSTGPSAPAPSADDDLGLEEKEE